ncbi:MAG: universal stress protein [Gammaproteobacteria bacterium]|nr:universal stress protein [Gammaproteobacteria bacterium]
MNILLATDGSNNGHLALDLLADFPIPANSTLTLLTVIEDGFLDYGDDDTLSEEQKSVLAATHEMLNEQAANMLTKEAASLVDSKLSCSTLIATGNPAEEIVRAAKQLDADLIVMSSHGSGDVKRFLLGSVSDLVLQYAHCSVLIVRPDRTGDTSDLQRRNHPLRVLTGFDNSDYSRKTIEFCSTLPFIAEDEILLLGVLPLITLYRQDIKQQLGSVWQQRKAQAKAGLEWAANHVGWSSSKVSTQLKESPDVSQEILDSADEFDADLIIVGNKGAGTAERFLLGSVTRRIAHHAPCSVLAVRVQNTGNETGH